MDNEFGNKKLAILEKYATTSFLLYELTFFEAVIFSEDTKSVHNEIQVKLAKYGDIISDFPNNLE